MAHTAKLFTFWLGPIPAVCSSDPEMVQQILTHPDCMEKPFMYDFVKLDHGMFAAKYHIWKVQRKRYNPTFNQKILQGYVPIFEERCQALVDKLRTKAASGASFPLSPHMLRCAMEMVCATTMGVDINQNPGADRLVHLMQTLQSKFFGFENLSTSPLSRLLAFSAVDPVFMFSPVSSTVTVTVINPGCYYRSITSTSFCSTFMEGKLSVDSPCQVFKECLNRKEKENEQFTNNNNDYESDGYRRPQTFINELLDLFQSKQIDEIEILHNIYTMVVAGSDTSGGQMALLVMMLGFHPDLQEKVYQEVIEVFPPGVKLEITFESLRRLEYTEMFIKEVLRLYPIAPNIMRCSLKDVQLMEGLTVPKDTIFIFNIYNLHRRPDIWGPDAEQFDPERFSPERSAGRHPFAFLPFSGGGRNCIGHL
ncbi:probable cytochrome P450 313a1 [Uranotaenia lowii]|uniref:probable cytochrome P450 313a1 n=1 Tax=Uranotaenia lowii TaxID=190385 RepID=UPI0024796BF0|nr:probable cytochrome P450 313a1 [Uranotaenia lowii]